MSRRRVLVLAAHADDETLGAGVAIARHLALGDDVQVVIAADCRTVRDPSREPDLLPETMPALDQLEGQSGRLIGVGFLGFRALTLEGSELALNARVGSLVQAFEPDVVYTHHWCDVNSDHRAMFRAAMVAMRPNGRPQRLYCFEVPSSTEWSLGGEVFKPNYFLDATDHIGRKLAALACYASELRPVPHPRNVDMLRARAQYWGQVAGCLYAEPFVLVREIVR